MRKARIKSETGLYHVCIRGVNRQDIFFDDYDKRQFLYYLKKYCNYSAPKIPGIMQEFQQRQVLQLQRRLFHVFLLSRYKNGF